MMQIKKFYMITGIATTLLVLTSCGAAERGTATGIAWLFKDVNWVQYPALTFSVLMAATSIYVGAGYVKAKREQSLDNE